MENLWYGKGIQSSVRAPTLVNNMICREYLDSLLVEKWCYSISGHWRSNKFHCELSFTADYMGSIFATRDGSGLHQYRFEWLPIPARRNTELNRGFNRFQNGLGIILATFWIIDFSTRNWLTISSFSECLLNNVLYLGSNGSTGFSSINRQFVSSSIGR